MNYPREYLETAEQAIRDYPNRKYEMQAIEDAIVASCHRPLYSEDGIKGNGSGLTEPEQIVSLKEQNEQYQWNLRHVTAMNAAIDALPKLERCVIELLCWQRVKQWEIALELKMEERQIRRIKNSALEKFVPICIHPDLLRKGEVCLAGKTYE